MMQAKNVPESRVLALVDDNVRVSWEIQRALSEFPPKVVLAKLRSMVKRGVLDGCACGCRGDFSRRERR